MTGISVRDVVISTCEWPSLQILNGRLKPILIGLMLVELAPEHTARDDCGNLARVAKVDDRAVLVVEAHCKPASGLVAITLEGVP